MYAGQIYFAGRPHNTLTLPCERVIITYTNYQMRQWDIAQGQGQSDIIFRQHPLITSDATVT